MEPINGIGIRANTPESVVVLQVIQVIACRGAGIEDDPIRHVVQFYSMDGRLLAENDPSSTEGESHG